MAHPRPKKKTKTNGKTRVNLRLPADLDTWAKKYAEDHNTNLTALVVGYLTELRAKTEAAHVDQI